MHDSAVGRVLWLAAKDTLFRSAARTNLGIAAAERGFILSNSEMATLVDFWETLDHVSDRRAQELIEGHARLYYAAVLEDQDAREEAAERGDTQTVPRVRAARTRALNARVAAAPSKVREQEAFLEPSAGELTLQHAFADNRVAWLVRRTEGARGEVERDGGLAAIASDDPAGMAQILLPWNADHDSAAQIDGLLTWLRSCPIRQPALCWSVTPPRLPDLAETLAARGFVCKFRPSILCLDLRDLISDHDCPGELTISLVNSPLTEDAPELPYYSLPLARARYMAGRELPRSVWYYAAWLDRELVGHCVLNITTGARGVGGLYDLGVVPSRRGQGIGKALTIVAAIKARELGCQHLLLNATGERLYAAVGCRRIGYGEMWLLEPLSE